MTEEIIKGIYRIPVTLPNSPLRELNSYLVRGRDRNLLIDTGFNHPLCQETMISAFGKLGVNMSVTDILLTHMHSDHSGLAPEIIAPERNIFISREDMPRLFSETRNALWAKDTAAMLRAGFPRADAENPKTFSSSRAMAASPFFKRYTPIVEGDLFPCGDYVLKAISSPGHTPGHMCFLIESEKLMFTGDAVLFDITPNITAWADTEDALGDYLASLKKLDRYDVKLALPGHRQSGDYHTRIKELLQHHEARLTECLQAVRSNPDSTAYELASKLTWNVHFKSWNAFPANQKWFAVGECLSHLQRLEALGYIVKDENSALIRYHIR